MSVITFVPPRFSINSRESCPSVGCFDIFPPRAFFFGESRAILDLGVILRLKKLTGMMSPVKHKNKTRQGGQKTGYYLSLKYHITGAFTHSLQCIIVYGSMLFANCVSATESKPFFLMQTAACELHYIFFIGLTFCEFIILFSRDIYFF